MAFNFALIGAAGFVAPRHMRAIRDTGNVLLAAYDPNDSVGILDSYFPNAHFFTEFERFDRHVDKCRRAAGGSGIDYIAIASPNYLHDSHIRFALKSGCNAICEKPLVLNPWNIDALEEVQNGSGRQVNSILQLRYHPAITRLKQKFDASVSKEKRWSIELTYITPRGKWYSQSWKGDLKKSGGIAANIGVHLFDAMHYVFGSSHFQVVHHMDDSRAGGFISFESADVRWFLSIEQADLQFINKSTELTGYRALTLDGEAIDFSDGFTDLHTKSYEEILAGRGFSISDCRPSIETVAFIRNTPPRGVTGDYHPLLRGLSEKNFFA
jgi:UDP-N-acetyl-2-amino-2-deoxyglucuronate dehydrogenase